VLGFLDTRCPCLARVGGRETWVSDSHPTLTRPVVQVWPAGCNVGVRVEETAEYRARVDGLRDRGGTGPCPHAGWSSDSRQSGYASQSKWGRLRAQD
jgi:hypothetical protein